MKKNNTIRSLLCLLLSVVVLGAVVFCISAETTEETTAVPTVTNSDVQIYSQGDAYGIRFDTQVTWSSIDGVAINEQGTLIVPLHIVGENEITVNTADVAKVVKNANDYQTYTNECDYVYSAALVDFPAYALNAPICARSYVTYHVAGGEAQTAYSDTVIYDLYSMAKASESVDATATTIQTNYEAYLNTTPTQAGRALTVTSPGLNETVFPYSDLAKTYLQASAASKDYVSIEDYSYIGTDAAKPINVTWNCTLESVQSFTVVYATKADYSDAKYVWADESATSVSLYNLYKATTYYVKVLANLTDGTVQCTESTFQTTELGPRVIHLDGVYNIRDIGGYTTVDGKRTKQGLIYRGGQMDDVFKEYTTALSAYGVYTAKNELGIQTDLDFRGNNAPSPITGAAYKYLPCSGYSLADTTTQSRLKAIFAYLADEANYPVIFHCQGGADRTGTVAFLLNGMLGVPEADLIRDYEFTSFSIYGRRSKISTAYMGKTDYAFFETLEAAGGETINEQIENYLKNTVGVTQNQIDKIRNLLLEPVG